MSSLKRNKTNMGELEAPAQKVKKLYGTKTSLDDLRLREGRRNELWEQALESDVARGGDTGKLKRRKLNTEGEPGSFAEILSVSRPSQESLAIGGIPDMEMDQYEPGPELHYREKDEITRDQSNAVDSETNDTKNDCSALDHPVPQDNFVDTTCNPIATPEASLEAEAPKDSSVNHSLAQTIAVSIPKHDANISQSPIIAPSISQLSNPPDPASSKPSRKRKQSIVSSQADELVSDDIIGLPKEQYKPRPSRSRRQNDHVDELFRGIDYSKTVESVVRSARKGKAGKSKVKRRQTTGCLLGSTKDWDEDENGDNENNETKEGQMIDEDNIVLKPQRKSKTTAAEIAKPNAALNVDPKASDEKHENGSSSVTSKNIPIAQELSTSQDPAELSEEDIKKPTRRCKPSTSQAPKSQPLPNLIESGDEDDLHAHVPTKPQGNRKLTTTEPMEPAIASANPEDADEGDDFQPLEDLTEPPISESPPKKKRGRPKKQDAETNLEPSKSASATQPVNDPPPKPASKRRKTKELASTQPNLSPPLNEPPSTQPLAESPAKANAILRPTSSSTNIPTPITDSSNPLGKAPPPLATPQKDKGASEQRIDGKEEAPSPNKKHHSPLSSSKVPLRVGLSRRQRIEPLLKVRR